MKKFYENVVWFIILMGIIFLRHSFNHDFERSGIPLGYIVLAIWAVIIVTKAVKLFIFDVFDAEWEKEATEKETKKDKEPIDF